jgi:type IV pilus assembly protein PilY1
VGQSFVKKAIVGDFVNYSSTNSNTSLGISFGIRGPYDSVNKSAPSPGGQTTIDIYRGDYNEQNCQDAVIALQGTNLADMKKAVCRCLTNDDQCKDISGTQTAVTKTKVAFQQTIQACWQCKPVLNLATGHYDCSGHDIGTDEINTVKNQCTDVVNNFATCDNNPDIVCTADSDCGTGTCIYGPAAIVPGNPALLCSSSYEGQYFYLASGTGVCKKNNNPDMGACTSDDDCTSPGYKCVGASLGGWQVKSPEPTEDMKQTHRDFCGAFQQPLVIDPTDSPSDTTMYDNVPAILSGIGVEAQLSQPIASLPVKVKWHDSAKSPEGLLQELNDKLRIGLMTFNFNGAKTETGTTIPLQKVCSTDTTKTCASDIDCPTQAAGTCVAAVTVSSAYISDGAKIIHDVGKGMCEGTATVCTTSTNCSSGQRCIIRDQDKLDLVNELNAITAKSWTPFAEAFYNAIGYYSGRADLRVNTTDFDTSFKPSEYRCQANNILFVSDGMSTADQYPDSNTVSSTYTGLITGDEYGWSTGCVPPYGGSKNIDTLSWIGKNKKISTFSKTDVSVTATPVDKKDTVTTYVVFNGTSNGLTGECNSETILSKTASNGGTSIFKAELPDQFTSTLRNAFNAIAGGTASGTAASILSNSEGSGANILQAVFYPYKEFENKTNAAWIGEMQNLWYYVDPFIGNSTVREDTDYGGTGDHQLDVKKDYVVNFVFDQEKNETKATLYKDTNGDGSGETMVTSAMDTRVKPEAPGVVNADDVKSIWRAGKLLWARDISASPRKLYTQLKDTTVSGCTGSFSTSGLVDLVSFNWAADATNSCILQKLLNAATQDEAKNIIKYAHGYDHVDYYGATDPLKTSAINGTIDGAVPRKRMVSIGGVSKVWKLGDIISSTPRVQSSNKLNNYHQDPPVGYGDATYASDSTGKGFANSDSYKNRGMVYTGANDGMLHAFKMGKLTVQTTGDVKGTLSGDNLGKEEWAFVPKDVLPYLKFLASPGYSHVYLMDGPSKIVDASIGTATLSGTGAYATAGCGADSNVDGVTVPNYWACQRDSAQTDNKSWRTVLISSMGVGGASSNTDATCSNSTDCVKTPVSGAGFSTYYALDITDPANPSFMWEFKHDDLGYSTTGAAVVRVAHKLATGEYDTNGRWFAVVGNGPTGAINTTTHQFTGVSTKDLALFVLDLRNGALLKKLAPSAAVTNAFVGSIAPGAIDINRSQKTSSSFYSDDAVYVGYTQCTANCTTAVPAWDGGILRLITKVTDDTSHSTYLNSVYPKDWNLSILASGTGPITAAIGKLQDRKNKNLWLYAGAGRYFFKDDDKASQGKLLGIKDPCYEMDAAFGKSKFKNYGDTCYTAISFNDTNLLPQTTLDTDAASKMASKKGWYITLGAQDTTNDYGAERIITDPVAMPNGAVFFTSFMPSTDVCNFGGQSYMWGVQYDSGGVASSAALQGKALVQVSTGSFEEINLSTAFKAADGTIGRKMVTPMVGKPPTDPPPIVSASGNKPLKRIIHVQEK